MPGATACAASAASRCPSTCSTPTCRRTTRRIAALTDSLYGGDERYRLCQEAVLGIGGVAMLRALGHAAIARFHLNEGHAALLVLGLLEERLAARRRPRSAQEHVDAVRDACVFTTHTPVPAGHDQFPPSWSQRVLGERRGAAPRSASRRDAELNMTDLALRGSGYVNGVAMSHGEVSRDMFPDYKIHAITNGVHVRTWASPPFQALFDRWLPDWRARLAVAALRDPHPAATRSGARTPRPSARCSTT